MSFLFGTKAQPAAPNKRLGLFDTSTATNEQAQPLPYLAGTRRFAGTFITDAFDQSTQTVGGGGKNSGKGGGGTGTNYYAGFAVAFCLGPVDGIYGLFLNGDDVWTENNPLGIQSLKQYNNVATLTTTAAHGLSTGQQVLITGVDQPEFNGQFTITVTGANTFTYIIPGSSILSETAGGSNMTCWVQLAPILRGHEDFIQVTIPGYGLMTLYWGTETQPADGYLPVSGTNHPPYHGVCYAVFQSFFLGLNQTNIQNVEIVLSRCLSAPWQNLPTDNNINGEANAAIVLYDLLTNPRCGLGLTPQDFNTAALATAASRLVTEGIGISPVITSEDAAQTLWQKILESVDGLPLLDPVTLLLAPALVRAPASYIGLPTVGDADLADIPQPKSSDWSNTFNDTRIVFPNKDAAWNNDFVQWKDDNAYAAAQKTTQPQTLQRDFITNRTTALALVKAAGLVSSTPPATGSLSLLFTVVKWNALAPGSLFSLNYSLRPNGGGIFRVTKRTFKDSAKPVFDIEYAADRSYLNASL